VLPNLPGFLVQVHVLSKDRVPAFFLLVYNYAWFVGFAVAFLLHLAIRQTIQRIRP
jgi:NCS1 family nucleobase:cation symporter-1